MEFAFNSIEDAWFHVCRYIDAGGRLYTIDRGSFESNQRKQVDMLSFRVRPNSNLVVTYKGQYITTNDQIEIYFLDYLMNADKKDNEEYTYGSRIAPHLPLAMEMLKCTPNTNQATIEISRPEDINLEHPPCLRSLSFKVVDGKLNLASYWRSWDVHQGLPVNLGGLTLLNRWVAGMVNLKEGDLICFSDGAHIYSHAFGLV